MKAYQTTTEMACALLLACISMLATSVHAEPIRVPTNQDPIVVFPSATCPWIELLWESPFVVFHPECLSASGEGA